MVARETTNTCRMQERAQCVAELILFDILPQDPHLEALFGEWSKEDIDQIGTTLPDLGTGGGCSGLNRARPRKT